MKYVLAGHDMKHAAEEMLLHLLPTETHKICADFFAGNVKASADAQIKYLPLIGSLFCEVNPIPVKEAMHLLGFCDREIRLPLCEMEDTNVRFGLFRSEKSHC